MPPSDLFGAMKTWRDGWLVVRQAPGWRRGLAALSSILLASVGVGAKAASVAPPSAQLQEAWSFACAITNDDRDRARCQAKVAGAWLAAGEAERAVRMAKETAGWQELAIYADAARHWAAQGRTNEAVRALAEVETRVPGLSGWPYDRVQTRLAHALAALGRRQELETLAGHYRENRECLGAIQVARALEAAQRGAVAEAVGHIDALGTGDHLDLAAARAEGFRRLLACGALPREKADAIVERAWAEASAVPGWRRVDLQLELVDTMRAAGRHDRALRHLTEATKELRAAPYPQYVKAAALAEAALRWADCGEAGMLERLNAECLQIATNTLELIEQPALLARLAEAQARAGSREAASGLFRQAVQIAGGLTNPRPRAIAAVEVMLAMARSDLDESQLLEERRRLLASFDPRGS